MQQQRRRSGIIIGLLSLTVLAGVALTVSSAQAVSGPGPYYAVPAWDQIKGAGRFLVLTNWASAAVLDKETGLVWERTPAAGVLLTWANAKIACMARTTGNRIGWRLPSVHELASLVDPSVSPGPTLQPGHPFLTVQSAIYWSATTYAEDTAKAWGMSFDVGSPGNTDKAANLQVWCVRGGNSADAY